MVCIKGFVCDLGWVVESCVRCWWHEHLFVVLGDRVLICFVYLGVCERGEVICSMSLVSIYIEEIAVRHSEQFWFGCCLCLWVGWWGCFFGWEF